MGTIRRDALWILLLNFSAKSGEHLNCGAVTPLLFFLRSRDRAKKTRNESGGKAPQSIFAAQPRWELPRNNFPFCLGTGKLGVISPELLRGQVPFSNTQTLGERNWRMVAQRL
jgi:hypothetical protein